MYVMGYYLPLGFVDIIYRNMVSNGYEQSSINILLKALLLTMDIGQLLTNGYISGD